ncbi:uncharacterized protein LOC130760366 [Actinidia eriantha]|uniref:uncharacterized protein LOC130760366 n=1 Tax=Actinidia eriantha TaxID=165200 RepID=UPI00258B78B7|nr:uncharacterized protein LOC130760366 [Actinidia eriantha]
MVSREHKRAAALHEKLQLLRSITNSHALNNTSIIIDASKYIEDLKQKVETLNQDIEASQNSSDVQDPWPMVTVETLVEKGFQINVVSEKSCPGMLVFILEAFEELGLNVLESSVSCTDNFHLVAVGKHEESRESIDAQLVKQAVYEAIKNWSESEQDSSS